ncbi:hypothetical protein EDB92DRAFT_1814634 [Lactarius akahatsu]|uniref:Uncharacterized protein n=1 Tax=Lactarius akahatsu TaxID=416441 RepID=A0AAD4QCM0_9AGAM|nr:hypothetical protein EDB92DRAFT_1814634 [Lactarius akahatsu]
MKWIRVNSIYLGDRPSTRTKAHPKHTEHLPGNHGKAEAEKSSFVLNGDPRRLQSHHRPAQLPAGRWPVLGYVHAGLKPDSGSPLQVVLTAGVFLCKRAAPSRRGQHYATGVGDEFHEGFMDEYSMNYEDPDTPPKS